MITLKDIASIDDAVLNTLPRKIVFLLLKEGYEGNDRQSYKASSSFLTSSSSLPRRSVEQVLSYLVEMGAISRARDVGSREGRYKYTVHYEPEYDPKAYKGWDRPDKEKEQTKELDFNIEELNMDQQYNFDNDI